MSREHELKVLPPYFELLVSGDKTFEVRRNDRCFQAGDVLWLRRYDTSHAHIDDADDPECCYGPGIKRRVSFVFNGDDRFEDGLLPGFVVLALEPVSS